MEWMISKQGLQCHSGRGCVSWARRGVERPDSSHLLLSKGWRSRKLSEPPPEDDCVVRAAVSVSGLWQLAKSCSTNVPWPWNWYTLHSDPPSLSLSKGTYLAWTPEVHYKVWQCVSVYRQPASAHSQPAVWQTKECWALVEWCWQWTETCPSVTLPTTNTWDWTNRLSQQWEVSWWWPELWRSSSELGQPSLRIKK